MADESFIATSEAGRQFTVGIRPVYAEYCKMDGFVGMVLVQKELVTEDDEPVLYTQPGQYVICHRDGSRTPVTSDDSAAP